MALMTFIVPQGQFQYCCAPMGLSSSGDEYCTRGDTALCGIQNIKKIMDDILIHATAIPEILQKVQEVFERCRKHGITLSREKVRMGNEVKFAGYILSDKGVRVDPDKLKAIRDFPEPTNVTQLRSFLGLATQLGKFMPDLTQATIPLRALLKNNTARLWLPEHSTAMTQTKAILLKPAEMNHFDISKSSHFFADASRLYGLGYTLIQYDDHKPHIIQCGSRSLSSAETNYAIIELECLAIVWAIQKCRIYLARWDFIVYSDHKPLKQIFETKSLDYVEGSWIHRLVQKVSSYTFQFNYMPGKDHMIADALLRAPVFKPDSREVVIMNSTRTRSQSDPLLKNMDLAVLQDTEYQKIVQAFDDNKPIKKLLITHPARQLISVWHRISKDGDLLLVDSQQIIIPVTLCKGILQNLHKAHVGITKTRQNAQQCYFWPGINKDTSKLVGSCLKCQKYIPSNPADPPI